MKVVNRIWVLQVYLDSFWSGGAITHQLALGRRNQIAAASQIRTHYWRTARVSAGYQAFSMQLEGWILQEISLNAEAKLGVMRHSSSVKPFSTQFKTSKATLPCWVCLCAYNICVSWNKDLRHFAVVLSYSSASNLDWANWYWYTLCMEMPVATSVTDPVTIWLKVFPQSGGSGFVLGLGSSGRIPADLHRGANCNKPFANICLIDRVMMPFMPFWQLRKLQKDNLKEQDASVNSLMLASLNSSTSS